jgi:hypothetical protein
LTAGHPYPEDFEVKGDKVLRYLFNRSSEDGAPKGDFLMHFGFSPDRPLELMEALGDHPSPATWTRAFEAPHGVKFYFEGPLRSPDGRNPVIRTVWQVDYDGDGRTARFITIKIRVPKGPQSQLANRPSDEEGI